MISIRLLIIIVVTWLKDKLERQTIHGSVFEVQLAVLTGLEKLGEADIFQLRAEIERQRNERDEKNFASSSVYAALGYLVGQKMVVEGRRKKMKGPGARTYRLNNNGRRYKGTLEEKLQSDGIAVPSLQS